MTERIYKILQWSNLTPTEFADECHIIRAGLNGIISGRNSPTIELIQKILIRYHEISAEWLLLGRGEIIKTEIKP